MTDEPIDDSVWVIAGSPDDRPSGSPCFGCGEQAPEGDCVTVVWPTEPRTATTERVCDSCGPQYPGRTCSEEDTAA